MCPNTVNLPSIIFLVATLCSLAWPDLTIFSFVWGRDFSISTQNRKKAVWPRETIQRMCLEDFLLQCCLINLCIRGSHESSIQLKKFRSLNRHHRHGATWQLTQCALIIMIYCHHPPKFFLPKCLDGWIHQSFRPPKFCAIR